MTANRRMCAIGLDAAEWTLVEPLLAAGDLPHLANLRRRSAFALLHDRDYRTGLVWEHFLTGRGAASNRRAAVTVFDPGTYDIWREGAWPVDPFYAVDPVETIVLDVPYLSLARPLPGAQVTGWGGHDP